MAANKYVALLLVVFLIAGSANARPKEVSCASICIDKECKSDFNSWCAIFNCGIKCALIGPQKSKLIYLFPYICDFLCTSLYGISE